MPGNTSAIRAGAAFVEIFADDSKVRTVLARVDARLRAFGQGLSRIGAGLTAVGTGIVAPLIAAARVAGEYGGRVLEASQKTGIGIEAIQELGFAAEQTGTSLEGLSGAMKFLQKNLVEAARGSQEAQQAFAALGLSYVALQSLAPEEQFARVAAAIGNLTNPAQRTAAALKLFGKSGTDLLPLLTGGGAGLARLREEARSLGQVLSADTIRSAEATGDAFSIVHGAIRATATAVGAALEPVLTPLAETFGRIARTVQDWVAENAGLLQTIFQVAAGVAAAGAVITGLGVALIGAGAAAAAISTALGAVGAVIGALATPIGLAITAVVALGVAFVQWTETGQAAFRAVSETIGGFVARIKESFAAIGDALAVGDIALAAKIAWLTLKVEAQRAIDFVLGYVRDLQRDAALIFVQLGAAIEEFWINLKTGAKAAIDYALLYISKGLGAAAKLVAQGQIGFKVLTGQITEQEGQRQQAAVSSGIEFGTEVLGRTIARDLAELGAQANRELADNAANRDEAIAEVFRDREQQRSAASEELAAAIAELNKAREESATKRAALEEKGKAAEDGSQAAAALAEKVTTTGAFNPFALRGLGSGDRLTNAAVQTAQNTKQLVEKLRPAVVH